MNYLAIAKVVGVVLVVSGALGYVQWLRSSLSSARAEITSLTALKDKLEGDLANARTRSDVEDAVRTDPDPLQRLRDRWSRPE